MNNCNALQKNYCNYCNQIIASIDQKIIQLWNNSNLKTAILLEQGFIAIFNTYINRIKRWFYIVNNKKFKIFSYSLSCNKSISLSVLSLTPGFSFRHFLRAIKRIIHSSYFKILVWSDPSISKFKEERN